MARLASVQLRVQVQVAQMTYVQCKKRKGTGPLGNMVATRGKQQRYRIPSEITSEAQSRPPNWRKLIMMADDDRKVN